MQDVLDQQRHWVAIALQVSAAKCKHNASHQQPPQQVKLSSSCLYESMETILAEDLMMEVPLLKKETWQQLEFCHADT